MSDENFTSAQFAAWAAAIRERESTDNYSLPMTYKHSVMGAYQMGWAALQDAGFVSAPGDWTALANSYGVNSTQSFLNTPLAQDMAFQNFAQRLYTYLQNIVSVAAKNKAGVNIDINALQYVGQTIDGVYITLDGLIAGASLVGAVGVGEFLVTNGAYVPTDGNTTPITEYLSDFSNYNFSFTSKYSGTVFSPAIDVAPNLSPEQRITSDGILSADGSSLLDISDGQLITVDGNGNYSITDTNNNQYTLSPLNDGSGRYLLTSLDGKISVLFNADIVTSLNFGPDLIINTFLGDSLTINTQDGSGTLNFLGGTQKAFNESSSIQIESDAIRVGSLDGGVGTGYGLDANGNLTQTSTSFLGLSFTGSFTGDAGAAGSLLGAANTSVGLDATPGGIGVQNNQLDVSVAPLTDSQFLGNGTGGDGTAWGDNLIFSAGGVSISDSGQAGTDFASLSSSSIANASWRPYYESLLDDFNDVPAATDVLNSDDGSIVIPGASDVTVADLVAAAVATDPDPSYTDPLLIDLTGNGIQVSDWVRTPVYFDTAVQADANGNPTSTPDGKLHETSWAEAGTGILSLDVNGDGKIDDITETVSEFLNAGSTPGKYADGLAALAALAQSGATAFNAQTSLVDAKTGKSYWSELVVWNDANGNGVTDPGELMSLDSLGITSISLQGSGNQGENIDGSAVTNRTTYTKADGSLGQAAAVNFQDDSIGDITTTASGGVVISSISEGGATAATTFVAQNSSAHSYTLSGGKLTDTTTGAVIAAAGITAVISTNQSDVISVAANDTGSYWLGGGTGADVLTGGDGTNVFLVNAKTVVHGGTGANSFNIAKVIGTDAVTLDMAADHLQEVIGGAGDGVFNASGTTWNVFVQGGSGNNIMIGGAAAAAFSGGTGDDMMELGAGGGVVHAGSGNDVIYGGSGMTAANQPVYINAGASSNAALVERLYEAGLGREADLSGFQTWLGDLNGGQSVATVVSDFLGSAEWQSRYAGDSDAQLIASLFQSFLDRAPTAAELSSWTGNLGSGATRGANLVQTLVTSAQSEGYWGIEHPGASDVIFAGAGNDIVNLGTNNAEVYAGTGNLTVVGNANGFSVVGFHGSYADYTLTHNSDGTITVTNINNMDGDGAVTMKNVTDLDFKDISQIPVASSAGLPVSDELNTSDAAQVTVNSAGQYVISAATLLANDIDYAGNTLSIRELLSSSGAAIARGSSGAVTGGTAALSADGTTITFTPTAGFTGLISFRYHIEDNKGNDGAMVQQTGTTNTAEMTATVYLNTPNQPTDPLLDQEWFLSAADVLPVWQDYTGSGVSVAVFDPSGNVDFSNPDLSANAGQSVTTGGTPGISELGNHATLVAGVIVAANDGQGAVGVAYGATLSSVALPDDLADSLGNLMTWSDYDVVNNSWTSSPAFGDSFLASPDYEQAYINAVSNGRGGLGTILVFAGGNDRADGRTTQDLNETNSLFGITVGGINATTDLGSLVISGQPFSEPGSSILVSAPANNITSDGITAVNDFGQVFGADTQTAAGTSFATPIVSGVVALMLQANPNLGYRDIQQILAYSADKVNDPTSTTVDPYNYWTTNGADNWNGGGLHYSLDYGYGEVDARAAVRLAETWQNQETQANLVQSATKTPAVEQLATSVSAVLKTNPDGTVGLDHYNYGYGYFSVAAGVSGMTLEHVAVTVDLDLTNVALANTEIVLGRLAASQPYNLWGNIDAPIYSITDQSVILYGETANPGDIITEADGHQHLVFSYDTVQYMGENSNAPYGWALALVNTATGQAYVTQPANWNITFYGASSTQAQQWIFTDEIAANTAITPVTAQDSFNAAAATGNDVIDLRAGTADSVVDGKSITVNGNLGKGFGGDGNDRLIANSAGDELSGGRGNDVLTGGTGNDQLDGGQGNDTLTGGGGSDIYDFNTGDGQDVIVNGLSTNTAATGMLQLGAGLDPANLWFTKSGNDLLIQVLGTTDQVKVQNWFANAGSSLQTLKLSDGSAIGTAAITALATAMTAYQSANAGFSAAAATAMPVDASLQPVLDTGWARTITGTGGNDVLDDLGIGNDTLVGNGGNDIYHFELGYGRDVIVNGATGGSGPSGTLQLGIGISPDQLWFSQSGNDLVVQALGTASQVTVRGWFSGGTAPLQTIVTWDGSTIGTAAINQLEAAMAAYQQSNPGFTSASATALPAALNGAWANGWNTTLTGSGGNDTLDAGGAGNDVLVGNGGSDSYMFNAGYGQDVIVNGLSSGGPSGQLVLGSGLAPAQLWFSAEGNDLLIKVLGTTSQVRIENWLANSAAQLQAIVAGDSSTITPAAVGLLLASMAEYRQSNPTFNPATASAMPATLLSVLPNDWLETGPTLTVQAAAGNAGGVIPLSIVSAPTAREGQATLSITIAGVPSLASLSAGTRDADGSWTLTPAQLTGLTLTAPAGSFAGNATLTVTSTATESNGTVESRTANLAVSITGVATAPTLAVQNATGQAGSAIPLTIASVLTATDGTESLSLTITGVPGQASLSAGTKNADGSWTLTPAQLAGLTLTAPAGSFAGTAALTVTATAKETDGSTASATASLPVAIAGVALAPVLTVQNAAGQAGGAITLAISSALTATDGAETLSVKITGLPGGASLSAGTRNADGSWTLTPAQLAGLTLTAPAGSFAGTAPLTVTATATETDGSTASTTASLPVVIAGVATAPTLTVQNATGHAGSTIPLAIASALSATDGAETLSVKITGLPTGASLSAGSKNADGSWTLTAAQLAGLTMTTATGVFGTFALSVTAVAAESDGSQASQSANLSLSIVGLAAAPTLAVNPASGGAGTAIALSIASALSANDGHESLSVTVTGVPATASLSAGTKNADGSWTLTAAQLAGLTLTAPAGSYAGTANLTVTSTASDSADGSFATTSGTLPVMITGTATAPILTVQNATGNVGNGVPLNIVSALTATDASETLAITLSGLPAGTSLSAGTQNSDGSWSLTAAQLAGLMLIDPAGGFVGTATLAVTATATETDGSAAQTRGTMTVTVSAIAAVNGTTGNEVFDPGASANLEMIGGGGDDTYHFGSGYGQDIIVNGLAANTAPSGTLVLGAGVSPLQLWFTQAGNDLVIQILGSASQLTIRGWFANTYAQLDGLQLLDGSAITTAQISDLARQMTAYQAANPGFNPLTSTQLPNGLIVDIGADWAREIAGNTVTMSGYLGNNVFTVPVLTPTSSLSLVGADGANTYMVSQIMGTISINDDTGRVDPYWRKQASQIVFGPDVDPASLWFTLSAGNLTIRVLGTIDSLTIQNWLTNPMPLEWTTLGPLEMSVSTINSVAAAMENYQSANPAFNPATATSLPPDWGIAYAWVPAGLFLMSGLGDDFSDSNISSGAVIDDVTGNGTVGVSSPATYVFNATDGQDVYYPDGGVLQFGPGLGPDNLWFRRNPDGPGLVINVIGSSSQLTLPDWFTGNNITAITLADGSSISAEAITDLAYTMTLDYGYNYIPTQMPTDNGIQFALESAWSRQIDAFGGGTLDGQKGDNLLVGEGGDPVYDFPSGYGLDTIINQPTDYAGNRLLNAPYGELDIGFGMSAANIWLQRNGDDLAVELMMGTGSLEELTVSNWFAPGQAYSQLSEIKLTGSNQVLPDAQVAQLVQAMASYQTSHPGFYPESADNPAITDPTVLAAVNSAWHSAA